MIFGAVPVAEAEGTLLAHSIGVDGGRLRKGRILSRADIDLLRGSGIAEVVVARFDAGDLREDEAAARVARALLPDGAAQHLSTGAPFTGRANLYADRAGVLSLDRDLIDALNRIDEAITLATLADASRVAARQMVATVKIIPYGLPSASVEAAEALLAKGAALAVHPVKAHSADLILTRTPGMSDKLIEKGAQAVRMRLNALGIEDIRERTVAHETSVLAAALAEADHEMVLVLAGSATSDRADVGPAALIEAGGRLTRFGMPVDPGNLLFLGQLGARVVIGLPGCARSPKLNGADWVIERVACGLDVGHEDIAAMGVGGLLKEISSRPEPRSGGARAPRRPRIAALLLAAGQSRRMAGRDKLLERVGETTLLRRTATCLIASGVDEVVCVLPPNATARAGEVHDLAVRQVTNLRAAEGMGTSIAAGVAALGPDTDAALLVMADMPDLTAGDIDRLLAAFDPGEDRAIVRACAEDGTPGHPVLFGRRFFEALRGLEGDRGAREIVRDHGDYLVDVPLSGQAAVTDLDTPEAWTAWRKAQT